MHLHLHRFFSSLKQPNPKTPTSESGPFSSLRASLSLTRSQKQKQQQQKQKKKPKAVHWGNITIIQETEDKPEPEPEPESKPYNHNHNHTHTDCKTKTKTTTQKPILKQPTPLDTTTSHASLWELIHETEARIRLNYEYLGITGDVALDAWFRKEEEAMFRRANAAARDNLNRRAREGVDLGVDVSVGVTAPVPVQDNEECDLVADVGAEKPRRALGRCLRVSVLRMPVMRARF